MTMSNDKLNHWGDILVVVVYFVCVLAVGVWSLCRPNRGSVRSYFLAGRSMTWIPVGASLFSSNVGSEHILGLAGTGAVNGIAVVLYEWMALPLILLLAWLFLPVYISAGVYTLPEYLQKRFGGQRLRFYLSVLAIVLYIVTKLAVSIFAGALFIQLSTGWNMYISIVALLVITGVFTVLGGLAAVIYTDTFQTAVMTVGAIILIAIGIDEVGGYDRLQQLYLNAVPNIRDKNTTCGIPPGDAFKIVRAPDDSEQPWPGLFLQSSIGCLWYWCCDQVIVQRTLAAKNLSHAKGGAILAGYLKILPMFVMIWPGMIARAMFPDEIGCVDADECEKYCGNPVGCSNIAYPRAVLSLMPRGLKGLLMAAMLSAIMSSLTSIFNSASTLFTMDLWRKFRRHATERELLIVGRVFIVILCGVSILWIPLVKTAQSGVLFSYIQSIQGYLGTPIGALFLFSVLWTRMNEHGAFWGIVVGHTCGVIRMVLDFVYSVPDCGGPDTRPAIVAKVHYTYFGQMSLVLTSLTIVIVSLLTKPMDKEKTIGMTWWTRFKPEDDIDVADTKENDTCNCVQKPQINDSLDTEDDIKKNNDSKSDDPTKVDSKTPEDEKHTEDIGKCKRWTDVICGIPDVAEEHNLDEEIEQRNAFFKENKFWTRILNINAWIAVVVLAFMIGFFS